MAGVSDECREKLGSGLRPANFSAAASLGALAIMSAAATEALLQCLAHSSGLAAAPPPPTLADGTDAAAAAATAGAAARFTAAAHTQLEDERTLLVRRQEQTTAIRMMVEVRTLA